MALIDAYSQVSPGVTNGIVVTVICLFTFILGCSNAANGHIRSRPSESGPGATTLPVFRCISLQRALSFRYTTSPWLTVCVVPFLVWLSIFALPWSHASMDTGLTTIKWDVNPFVQEYRVTAEGSDTMWGLTSHHDKTDAGTCDSSANGDDDWVEAAINAALWTVPYFSKNSPGCGASLDARTNTVAAVSLLAAGQVGTMVLGSWAASPVASEVAYLAGCVASVTFLGAALCEWEHSRSKVNDKMEAMSFRTSSGYSVMVFAVIFMVLGIVTRVMGLSWDLVPSCLRWGRNARGNGDEAAGGGGVGVAVAKGDGDGELKARLNSPIEDA